LPAAAGGMIAGIVISFMPPTLVPEAPNSLERSGN
jgi:hypothetical protein